MLAAFADPRIRVVRKVNGGLPRALNTGFESARGAFLTWTSDDNRYKPTALAELLAVLRENPSAPMVSADYLVIDEQGRRIGYDRRHVACFLYRAEVARKVGEYRPELRLVEDTDYWLRIEAEGGPIVRLRKPLYEYRVHGGSLSARRAGERALLEAKMYVDLAQRGLYRRSVELRLLDCARQAALYRQWDSLDGIEQLAASHGLARTTQLGRVARVLKAPGGWWVGRGISFAYGRAQTIADLIGRLREGTLRA